MGLSLLPPKYVDFIWDRGYGDMMDVDMAARGLYYADYTDDQPDWEDLPAEEVSSWEDKAVQVLKDIHGVSYGVYR